MRTTWKRPSPINPSFDPRKTHYENVARVCTRLGQFWEESGALQVVANLVDSICEGQREAEAFGLSVDDLPLDRARKRIDHSAYRL